MLEKKCDNNGKKGLLVTIAHLQTLNKELDENGFVYDLLHGLKPFMRMKDVCPPVGCLFCIPALKLEWCHV